jgi:putative cardiolipin synthase
MGKGNLYSRLAAALAALLIGGCATVSLDVPKQPSTALEDTSHTKEARGVVEWLGGRTDANGFYPLTEGKDAFGARLALMDSAEASIDAQYFLMKPDNAGFVFAAGLMEAAERGVRVRLLLDDVFTTVEDSAFSTMNHHPNVEVRIFNPVSRKGVYWFNYLGNFKLANRRMHNKSFMVANQIAIVG